MQTTSLHTEALGRRARARWLLPTIATLAACGPTSPAGGPTQPVAEAILIVGQAQDTLLVFYSRRPEESVGIGAPPDPVPSSQVQLILEEVGGATAPFVPDPAQPGFFVAALTIRADRTYRLSGRIGTATVSASVVTPRPIDLIEPAGDTIFASRDNPRIPYRLSAPPAVAWFSSDPVILFGADTAGTFFFFDPPDTLVVTLFGLEANAAAWQSAPFERITSPNVNGALGVFGAATTLKRVFVWR